MSTYVVVGASRGLGFAFLQVLAVHTDNTVIGLARDAAATKARLAEHQISNVHVLAADITSAPSMNLAAQEATRILGDKGVDVLINNAGYVSEMTALKSLKDFEDNPQAVVEDTQRSFDVNFFGTLNAVYAFLPLVRSGGLKKVIAISSGMGDIDFINEAKLPNAAPYASSKAALSTLFAKLNTSYADEGILFMSLCPGQVDTAEKPGELAPEDVFRLEDITALFKKYAAPDFRPMAPTEAAQNCLVAIERSSLETGHGGSFLSYNGTRRWM